MIGNV